MKYTKVNKKLKIDQNFKIGTKFQKMDWNIKNWLKLKLQNCFETRKTDQNLKKMIKILRFKKLKVHVVKYLPKHVNKNR